MIKNCLPIFTRNYNRTQGTMMKYKYTVIKKIVPSKSIHTDSIMEYLEPFRNNFIYSTANGILKSLKEATSKIKPIAIVNADYSKPTSNTNVPIRGVIIPLSFKQIDKLTFRIRCVIDHELTDDHALAIATFGYNILDAMFIDMSNNKFEEEIYIDTKEKHYLESNF